MEGGSESEAMRVRIGQALLHKNMHSREWEKPLGRRIWIPEEAKGVEGGRLEEHVSNN